MLEQLAEKFKQRLKDEAINNLDWNAYQELMKEDKKKLNELLKEIGKSPLYQRQMEYLENELKRRSSV
jgi:hypothetical protein